MAEFSDKKRPDAEPFRLDMTALPSSMPIDFHDDELTEADYQIHPKYTIQTFGLALMRDFLGTDRFEELAQDNIKKPVLDAVNEVPRREPHTVADFFRVAFAHSLVAACKLLSRNPTDAVEGVSTLPELLRITGLAGPEIPSSFAGAAQTYVFTEDMRVTLKCTGMNTVTVGQVESLANRLITPYDTGIRPEDPGFIHRPYKDDFARVLAWTREDNAKRNKRAPY